MTQPSYQAPSRRDTLASTPAFPDDLRSPDAFWPIERLVFETGTRLEKENARRGRQASRKWRRVPDPLPFF